MLMGVDGCPTGKLCYARKQDTKAIKGLPYVCKDCGKWHVTTHRQPFKPKSVHKASARDERIKRVWDL
jgi:hypothetical protein